MAIVTGTGNRAYEILLKILLIGDSGSCKTELLQRYMKEFTETDEGTASTIGLDFKLKDIVCRGKRIKLQLWDTAGHERFRSVTSSYYRGSHGCLLVFNLKKATSFTSLNYWLDEIKHNAPNTFETVLVAIGGSDSVETEIEVAREFSREKKLPLVEVDFQNTRQIEEAFNTIIEKVMDSYGRRDTVMDSVKLDATPYSDQQPRCVC